MASITNFKPLNLIRELSRRNADADDEGIAGRGNPAPTVQTRPEAERPMGQYPSQVKSSRQRVVNFIRKYCVPKPDVSHFTGNDRIAGSGRHTDTPSPIIHRATPPAAAVPVLNTASGIEAVPNPSAASPGYLKQRKQESKAAGKRRGAELPMAGSALTTDPKRLSTIYEASLGLPGLAIQPGVPGSARSIVADVINPAEPDGRRELILSNEQLILRLAANLNGLDAFAKRNFVFKSLLNSLVTGSIWNRYDELKDMAENSQAKGNVPIRSMTTALNGLMKLDTDRGRLTEVTLPLERLMALRATASDIYNTVIAPSESSTSEPLRLSHLGDAASYRVDTSAPKLPRSITAEQCKVIENALDRAVALRDHLAQEVRTLKAALAMSEAESPVGEAGPARVLRPRNPMTQLRTTIAPAMHARSGPAPQLPPLSLEVREGSGFGTTVLESLAEKMSGSKSADAAQPASGS